MKIEDAVWNPKGYRGKIPLPSTIALRNLKVGDCKRLFHEEASCVLDRGRAHCSMHNTIKKLRNQGWKLEYYHEKSHVLVIRRLE